MRWTWQVWVLTVVGSLAIGVLLAAVMFGPLQIGRGGRKNTAATGSGAAPLADDGMARHEPPTLVRVGLVNREAVQDRFDVIGRLREVRRAVVTAEVEGKILDISLEEGEPVRGGQTVLARVDDVWAKLEWERAESETAAAAASLEQSNHDLESLEALMQARAAMPKEVQDARTQVKKDRALLDAAVAARNRAQRHIERLAVIAPFDGVVIRKTTEVGQWVEAGSAVAEIISTGEIDAVIDVPERLVNQVRAGHTINVLIDPLELQCTGRVASINPFGPSTARTFPVKIRLDDRDGMLKAGMSVTAHLPVGEAAERLTVPRDAVRPGSTGLVVWVAMDDGGPASPKGIPVPVKVLFGHEDRYVVQLTDPQHGPPLAPQMKVVVEGAERLMFPGQPLRIAPATKKDAEIPSGA